jgi:hypothetical protein
VEAANLRDGNIDVLVAGKITARPQESITFGEKIEDAGAHLCTRIIFGFEILPAFLPDIRGNVLLSSRPAPSAAPPATLSFAPVRFLTRTNPRVAALWPPLLVAVPVVAFIGSALVAHST